MRMRNNRLITVILAGGIIMCWLGCKSNDLKVFDSGKNLEEFRREASGINLDLEGAYAYPGPILAYFRHYGLDYPGVEHRFGFIHSGQYDIAAHVFENPSADKTVFLVHGYVLSAFIFNRFIPLLLQEGYAVVAFDLPGHGLSGGAAADIADFDEYGNIISDLAAFAGDALPPPYAIVGHSAGAAGIIDYLYTHESRFTKHVLVAPLVRSDLYDISKFGVTLLGWALKDVPSLVRDSSSDKAYIDFVTNNDPLRPKKVPVSWAKALYAWNERLANIERTIKADAFIIQGDRDVVVEYAYNIEFLRRLVPGIGVRFITGGKHDLFQEAEPIRNEVFEAILSYLGNRDRNGDSLGDAFVTGGSSSR